MLISVRGSPDAVTFPTLNPTGSCLPHISPSPARQPSSARAYNAWADSSNLAQLIQENVFHTDCALFLFRPSLSSPFPTFLLAFGKGHSLIGHLKSTAFPPSSGRCVDAGCIVSLFSHFQALRGPNDKARWQPQGPARAQTQA